MRVLQLIDSLEAGGAERMAVNYANSLSRHIAFSGLVATRNEGVLKEQLESGVSYLFLDRKKKIDIRAIIQLRHFVKRNKISIVHAHGTSFFMAVLVKLVAFKIKIVWHDHNGDRSNQSRNENSVLRFCSFFFACIFTVNKELELWSIQNLLTKKVLYIPNFTVVDSNEGQTFLKGNVGKKIVCLSNLRHPKNHLFLVTAFSKSKLADKGWSLHLVGKDYHDRYSDDLKIYIRQLNLEHSVFSYGSCTDIYFILNQANIGVLASSYEGFPVTLLEYGLSKLAVISTNVGYCKEIICHNDNGILIDPDNSSELEEGFKKMGGNDVLRKEFGIRLYEDVFRRFSEQKVISLVVSHYNLLDED